MNIIHDPAPGAAADRIVLVMLPGAGDRAPDLVEQGFVRAVRERRLPVDAIVAEPRFDDYLEYGVARRIEQEIVGPARARGHARIWFMGISLGAMGALSHAREHGAAVEGLALLAPFLGTRGLIAEVTRAGGLRDWQPGTASPEDPERALLGWLKDYRGGNPALPRIHLGFGTEDRYAPASALLAGQLPGRQVTRIPGGHDWGTWLKLWERLLDDGLFSRNGGSV